MGFNYLGPTVRDLRKAAGLKIEDLAIAANTDGGNISRFERGEQGATPERLDAIADRLNITVFSLFKLAEHPPPDVGFQRRLILACKKANVLPEKTELARFLSCNPYIIERCLEGTYIPQLEHLQGSAEKLGVSATWLITGEGSISVDGQGDDTLNVLDISELPQPAKAVVRDMVAALRNHAA